VGYFPDSDEASAETESFPLVEAFAMEQLVKTYKTETTVVIFKVWNSAMAL
jgi:hypothetical protein